MRWYNRKLTVLHAAIAGAPRPDSLIIELEGNPIPRKWKKQIVCGIIKIKETG
jgi:hypothetical protein